MKINFYKEPIKTTKLSLTYCKNKIKTYNTPITKTILSINLFLIMFSSTYFFILKWILYVFPYIYNYVQKIIMIIF
jgi:hypothetical protein